jgi:hypothetical protein
MVDQANLADDLLRGAQAIAQEIYGSNDEPTVRRLYHEQDRWPIFKLDDTGVLYALRSRLKAHLIAKSQEKEARIAAAAKTTAVVRSKPRRRKLPKSNRPEASA